MSKRKKNTIPPGRTNCHHQQTGATSAVIKKQPMFDSMVGGYIRGSLKNYQGLGRDQV